MSDKDSVVVQKIPIPNASACHMGNAIITKQFNNAFIAGQSTVCGQCERLKGTFLSQPRKLVRGRKPLMIAALNSNMTETSRSLDIRFQHQIAACSNSAAFQER